MKKKVFLMLLCIAAVAIAKFVGKKTFEAHAYETSSLLRQNVEALTKPEQWGYKATTGPCPRPVEYKRWQVCEWGYGEDYTLTACMNSDC